MKHCFSVALVGALLAAVPAATAGTFSTRSLYGDGDSGIANDKAYTHAIDMGDVANRTVNGAVFTGSGGGGNFTLTAPGAGITKRFYRVQVRQ